MREIDDRAIDPIISAGGQEPVFDQVLQGPIEHRRVVVGTAEIRERLLTAGIGQTLAELDQAQEDAAGDLLAGRRIRKVTQGAIGMAGHRVCQAAPVAAHALVCVQGDQAMPHPVPEQAHRLLDQGQASLAGGVGDQLRRQLRLRVNPPGSRRLLDRLA